MHSPNQQLTLNKLPTKLQCIIFVDKHRLSIQIGTKRAKTCVKMCTYFERASVLHATVGGWATAIARPRAHSTGHKRRGGEEDQGQEGQDEQGPHLGKNPDARGPLVQLK